MAEMNETAGEPILEDIITSIRNLGSRDTAVANGVVAEQQANAPSSVIAEEEFAIPDFLRRQPEPVGVAPLVAADKTDKKFLDRLRDSVAADWRRMSDTVTDYAVYAFNSVRNNVFNPAVSTLDAIVVPRWKAAREFVSVLGTGSFKAAIDGARFTFKQEMAKRRFNPAPAVTPVAVEEPADAASSLSRAAANEFEVPAFLRRAPQIIHLLNADPAWKPDAYISEKAYQAVRNLADASQTPEGRQYNLESLPSETSPGKGKSSQILAVKDSSGGKSHPAIMITADGDVIASALDGNDGILVDAVALALNMSRGIISIDDSTPELETLVTELARRAKNENMLDLLQMPGATIFINGKRIELDPNTAHVPADIHFGEGPAIEEAGHDAAVAADQPFGSPPPAADTNNAGAAKLNVPPDPVAAASFATPKGKVETKAELMGLVDWFIREHSVAGFAEYAHEAVSADVSKITVKDAQGAIHDAITFEPERTRIHKVENDPALSENVMNDGLRAVMRRYNGSVIIENSTPELEKDAAERAMLLREYGMLVDAKGRTMTRILINGKSIEKILGIAPAAPARPAASRSAANAAITPPGAVPAAGLQPAPGA